MRSEDEISVLIAKGSDDEVLAQGGVKISLRARQIYDTEMERDRESLAQQRKSEFSMASIQTE